MFSTIAFKAAGIIVKQGEVAKPGVLLRGIMKLVIVRVIPLPWSMFGEKWHTPTSGNPGSMIANTSKFLAHFPENAAISPPH